MEKRVMVFGVFDLLHLGHINFLRQAKRAGDFLVVSVARDTNAQRQKGYQPVFGEKERLKMVAALKLVDKAILGGLRNPWPHILREKPDIIALGYDQKEYIKDLKAELNKKRLKTKVVRLKPYQAERYKTSKIRKKIKQL